MKHHRVTFLVLAAVLAIQGCTGTPEQAAGATPGPTASPTPSGPVLNIPQGSQAQIDGTMEEGEWEDALVTELSDGGLLYLKYAGDSLYLAIDAEMEGIVNVGLLRGEELHILHSSAALGSAIYQATSDGWQMTKNFEWCCRVSAPVAQLEGLLAEEGWLSHNQYYGDTTQTEYRIVVPADRIRIAVTFIHMDHSGSGWWPVELSEQDLLQFDAPPAVGELAVFSDHDWVTLIVTD